LTKKLKAQKSSTLSYKQLLCQSSFGKNLQNHTKSMENWCQILLQLFKSTFCFASILLYQKLQTQTIVSTKKIVSNTFSKNCLENAGEIDTCSQFHQHYKSSFCANLLLPKKYKMKL